MNEIMEDALSVSDLLSSILYLRDPFLLLRIAKVCSFRLLYIPFHEYSTIDGFTHFVVDRHLGYFQFGTIVHNASEITLRNSVWHTQCAFPSGKFFQVTISIF